MTKTLWSRRSFVAASALLPFALRGPASAVPVGLEMYSVRDELKRDPAGTVRAVAAMGYQGLEFYAPYFDWTPAEAKDMRKLLDDLGIRCFSTHNDSSFLGGEKLQRTIELNLILGSKYAVVASAHPKPGPDAWREVADMLNSAADALEPHGLKTGYHNHQPEFRVTDGRRPMDILAKNTKPSVMLQLDVGTCLEANANPVAWIQVNPGRIRSMHCKDWSADPAKGYSVLFGEGDADWKALFQAAEHGGGIEYYLVEQEGSRYAELETAKRCLEAFRKTHGS